MLAILLHRRRSASVIILTIGGAVKSSCRAVGSDSESPSSSSPNRGLSESPRPADVTVTVPGRAYFFRDGVSESVRTSSRCLPGRRNTLLRCVEIRLRLDGADDSVASACAPSAREGTTPRSRGCQRNWNGSHGAGVAAANKIVVHVGAGEAGTVVRISPLDAQLTRKASRRSLTVSR